MLRKFFLPATLLMNKLRFNLKFSLIVVLFFIPILMIAITYYHQVNNLSIHTRSEIEGVQTFKQLNQLQLTLMDIIAKDMAWRSGQNQPPEISNQVQLFIEQVKNIEKLEHFDQRQKEVMIVAIAKVVKILREKTSLPSNSRLSAVDIYSSFSIVFHQFNHLYTTVSNLKGLTNDPQVSTVMLSRLISEKCFIWLSLIIESYGVTGYAVGEGEVSSGTLDSLSSVSDDIFAELEAIKNIDGYKEGLDPQLQSIIQHDIDAMLQSVNDINTFIEDNFLFADEFTLKQTDIKTFFNQQLKKYYDDYQELSDQLMSRLELRLHENQSSLTAVLLTVLIVLFAVIYLFVGMSFSISMTANSLSHVAQKLASGDTRVSTKVWTKDELSTAIKAFNQMAKNVHELVKSVQNAALGVAEHSQSVKLLAERSGEAVNTQSKHNQSITTSIAELLEFVNLISQNTVKVIGALTKAAEETMSGRKALSNALNATNELADEIERSKAVTNSLSEKSDSINQVLDVIKSIAEQTNLLALNAAIEAARAGDQGRGFAVVADEVRSLAKRTHDSIEEIQETILGLQNGVSAAVEAMTHSDEKAQDSMTQSAKLELAFDQITEAVNDIREQNNETENASERQQAIAQEIEVSLQSMSKTSSSTEDNVHQSIEASQELASLVARLETLVSNFKT